MGYRGMSQIISFDGRVQSVVPHPGESVVTGTIDIHNLRRQRTFVPESGHVKNSLALIRSDLYAPVYAAAKRWPNDGWADEKIESITEPRQLAKRIIDTLIQEGNVVPPSIG
jgi:hypothetical protein